MRRILLLCAVLAAAAAESHNRRLKGGFHEGKRRNGVKLEYINPDGLVDASEFGYSQVVTTKGGQLVFVSGQVPVVGPEGVLPEDAVGDKGRQFDLVFDNIEKAVAGVPGATLDNVVFTRISVKDYSAPDLLLVTAFLKRFPKPPASELVGVQNVPLENVLVEVSLQLMV